MADKACYPTVAIGSAWAQSDVEGVTINVPGRSIKILWADYPDVIKAMEFVKANTRIVQYETGQR